MGFRAVEQGRKAASVDRAEILQYVEPEDLLGFGFIPEFIGRLPMVTVLAELTEEQLVSILTETKNALIKQYRQAHGHGRRRTGISAGCPATSWRRRPSKKGTGARALRRLLEKLMLDVMYEVPSSDDILSVKITRSVVLGESKPIIRRKQDQAAA